MKRTEPELILLAAIGALGVGTACSALGQGGEVVPASRDASVDASVEAMPAIGTNTSLPISDSSSEPLSATAMRSEQEQMPRFASGARIAPDAADAGRPSAKILLARALVLDHLRDPSSARFRFERELQGGEIVCMEVNSNDGFGGEIGFTQAVVIARPGVAPVVWVDGVRQHVARAACESA